jgi:uncharacterized protein
MSPLILFFTALVVLVTSFISGIFGMAGGLMLMGFLLAIFTVPAAMVLHGITQMASNGWRAILWRHMIDWRVVGEYTLGLLFALGIFLFVRVVLSKPTAYICLGIVPLTSLMLPKNIALNVDNRGHSFLCGVVCTIMQLLAGVTGLLLDVFFVQCKMDRRQIVATKATTQTLGHIVKIIYFGELGAGMLGEITPALAAMCIVIAMIGATLSRRVLEGISDASFRQWTRGIVLMTGAVYLVYGLVLRIRA